MGADEKPKFISVTSIKETEEFLGPLPSDWEQVAVPGNTRKFFAHHPTRTTTWIDPRTKLTRKMSMSQVSDLELPYGWEELQDPELGSYFVDHISKKYFTDGPWEHQICERAKQHRAAREALLKEEAISEAMHQTEAALEAMHLKENVEASSGDNAGRHLDGENKAAFDLDAIQRQLNQEIEKKRQAERNIFKMKQDILDLAFARGAVIDLSAKTEFGTEEPETSKKTITEPGLLTETLKRNKTERKRMEKIGKWMSAERERLQNHSSDALPPMEDYQLPIWISHLDRNTVRAQIKKALPEDPENLEFAQKLAKFESNAQESLERPKAPSVVPIQRALTARPPKETAYAEHF
jgi:hypothetical protein